MFPTRVGRPVLRVLVVILAITFPMLTISPSYAAGASISGKVTKPSGNGLADSVVDLYRVYTDENELNASFEHQKSVKTTSDGTYTFSSLPRGAYVVGFGAESKKYAAEFWSNDEEIREAERISLGSTAVKGINAKLDIGATVRGRVVTEGPDPRGVAGAEVVAYRDNQGSDGWTFDKYAVTSSDGTFAVSGLTWGQFTLEFNAPTEGPDSDLALEYWNNKRAFSIENEFSVRLGETYDGFDAALSPGGRISGRVTGPDGEPVAGAPVFSYPNWADELGNVAITDAEGNYVLKGLSAGNHRLEFYGPYAFDRGYTSEWWNDRSTFDAADPILVVAGETAAGKDVQLAAEGTPIANSARPTITGTPKVAERLTADAGSWAIEPAELEYQWLADGLPIADAKENHFTIEAGQVGKAITVEVTASRPGFEPGRARSASTAPVAKGTFTNEIPPELTNATRVGNHVWVQTSGEWSPGYPVVPSRTLELLADGEVLPSPTAFPFEVPPDLLGKRLSLRVDVTLAGFDSASATSEPSAPILPGVLTPTAKPELIGVASVGERITAGTGSWDQSGQTDKTLTFDYQWLVDGTEIEGADSAEFTPPVAYAGKSLTVEITASRPGYTSATSASDSAIVTEARDSLTLNGREPSISGAPSVGSTLTAEPGIWEPDPTAFTYEWRADGDTIAEATGRAFRPSAAEAGKRISVTVTASRSGYAPGIATSAETAPVVVATPFGAPRNLKATKTTVTTIDLSWTKVDSAARYRIYYGIGTGKRTKVEVDDVTTTQLNGLKPGKKYSIDIAALTSNGTRSPYSPRINASTKALVPPSDLTVSDRTRTSLTITWTKVPGVPKYRIWHGIGSGTRTKTEVGDVSTRIITGLKPGTNYSIDIASMLSDGTRSSYTPRITGTTAD